VFDNLHVRRVWRYQRVN